PTKLVYQSPTGLELENIAVRPSGKLLLTSVLSPEVHTLDPASTNATLEDIYTFPNSTGLLGIVGYKPDVYALVACTFNLTARSAVPGTVMIWGLDLTAETPVAWQIVAIPESSFINGMSSVPGYPDLVLAADSFVGAAYQITISTGTARIAIQDAAMAPGAPAPALGINGLHVHAGALYFTNSELGTFSRIPVAVDELGVHRAGDVQVLGLVEPSGPTHLYDDFAIDSAGRAWVTVHPGALTLLYPLANGTWTQENAAGDPEGSYAVFTEPTSAVFGAGGEVHILYVTTEAGQ
ncbi:hypothetical protein DFH07DRAFT_713084, partial [Mycena maculata]